MKLTKIFALVLCLCLLVTAFSGCSKEDKLSAKKEQEIKEAYVVFHNEQYPDYIIDVDTVFIQHYFGTYNGAAVMLIEPNRSVGLLVGSVEVAGYIIETNSSDAPVFVYKDGKFTEIEEAYESGMLTEEDICDIANGKK
ncbi:MAG: hypothetical protein GX802_00390 [Clostridiales bacterium]|nr:hypothetical protein [Clostridiales bacterium]